MTDKNPASLTSSLLARKGDAAPSHEGGQPSNDPPDISASIEGTPIEADAADDFLSRGPDAITPEPEPESPSWDSMVDESANAPSRWRRAPLLVLAVLLVFVLAGAAWFAANIFMDGGTADPNSMATAERGTSNGASTDALQQTSGQPLAPAASTTLPDPEPRPPSPVAETPRQTAAIAVPPQPPMPVDPVTTDPQDAPRIANERATPDKAPPAKTTPLATATAAATNNPLPPASSAVKAPMKTTEQSAPPLTVAVPPVAKAAPPAAKIPAQPEKVAPPPVKATARVDPPKTATAAKPIPPAKRKPPVKVASRTTGTYAVQLSSVKSSSIAQREVRRLSRRFGGILNGTALRVRTANLGGRGKVFRIQTAAVLTSAQAKRLCGRLKSRKQPCFVVAR